MKPINILNELEIIEAFEELPDDNSVDTDIEDYDEVEHVEEVVNNFDLIFQQEIDAAAVNTNNDKDDDDDDDADNLSITGVCASISPIIEDQADIGDPDQIDGPSTSSVPSKPEPKKRLSKKLQKRNLRENLVERKLHIRENQQEKE
ncbi:transcriptional regulator IFH1-like [Nilaparvata lugens]|uniref:transcriptional regulator IFH1-like n=1 Tax=Nilaparvata lugens TaxID=108931 RepID=UPI00193DF3B7|nr:transcriptional regulator IFH1-like [Nilaparvata lugens]